MKRVVVVSALLILAVTALVFVQPTASAEEARDGLLMHMSTGPDEPHRVLQPLGLALKMSQMQPVRVFIDIEAVHAVTKDAEDLTLHGFAKSSHEMVKALVDAGVGIHVCPTCLKVAGLTEEDLMDGLVVAGPDTFTGFTTGRIVTLDW